MTTSTEGVSPTASYSPTEAARVLGIDPSTLWRKTRRGQIICRVRASDGGRFYKGLDLIKYFNGEKSL